MAEKRRLDNVAVEKGFAENRTKAAALIMSGEIYVNGQKETKAGYCVKETDVVEFRGKVMPFVSRGGYKLEKAMKRFPIKLDGAVCMDIGASTGGFTDCMLQCGALRVYAIDVGYGQLAWKLRTDERVVNLERTNFRYLTDDTVKEKIDFASIDVSFISLKNITARNPRPLNIIVIAVASLNPLIILSVSFFSDFNPSTSQCIIDTISTIKNNIIDIQYNPYIKLVLKINVKVNIIAVNISTIIVVIFITLSST